MHAFVGKKRGLGAYETPDRCDFCGESVQVVAGAGCPIDHETVWDAGDMGYESSPTPPWLIEETLPPQGVNQKVRRLREVSYSIWECQLLAEGRLTRKYKRRAARLTRRAHRIEEQHELQRWGFWQDRQRALRWWWQVESVLAAAESMS